MMPRATDHLGAMSVEHPTDFVKQQTPTRDAFLGGRLKLSQPRNGFRAGLDSVLLGAAVDRASASLLDLGAGVGTAGLVALTLNHGLVATLAELDPATAALAAENVAANDFAARARVVEVDVTAPGLDRVDAGLTPDTFTSVIANPPFFDPDRGTAPSAERTAARHMAPEALDLWIRTAASTAAPGGEVIFIYPTEGLPTLLAGFSSRFGGVALLPLVPHEGEAASRVLIRGIKGSRAPTRLLSSRILHETGSRGFHPAFDAIFRGTGRLDW
jgi:tRNA1(Val) A37 N6-methylase TrmN6